MGKKVKVVLDTNVWISIFLRKTLSREFFDIIKVRKIEIYITEEILKEISKVLIYPKINELLKFSGVSEKEIIRNIIENSKLVKSKFKLELIKEDPEDNKVLECALQARANFIVSGNKHLLKLKKFKRMKILTPREFLDEIKSNKY